MLSTRCLLLLSITTVLSAADETSPPAWPYQKWCNPRLVPINNSTACTVENRSDLPSVKDTAIFDVYFAIHHLSAAGDVAKMLSLTHSLIWIRERGANPKRMKMLIEYAGIYFPASMFPTKNPDATLRWDDDAVVAWQPEENRTDWLAEANRTHLGHIKGSVLNKYFDWVTQWRQEHQGYQVWSVWDNSSVIHANRRFNDSVCHTFTEESIVAMHNLGAKFTTNQIICRNYFPYVATTGVAPVDMNNYTLRTKVDKYYDTLDYALKGNFSDFGAFADHLREVLERANGVYVHARTHNESYSFARLTPPFLSKQIYQRLVLPWQDQSHATIGECGQDVPDPQRRAKLAQIPLDKEL